MSPKSEKLVSRVSYAMIDEGDRWFIRNETPWDHICRRDDGQEEEDATVVMSVPHGDADMHFWDARQRAMTIAGLEAAGIRLD